MRHPLVLLVASAVALVGLVMLVVAFLGIGTHTLQTSQNGDSPCLQAYAADLPGSHVRYTAFPPQSVCTYEVDGVSTSVVVESTSATTAAVAWALALGGAGVCIGVLVAPRFRKA